MALKVVMQNDRDFTELSLLYLILRVFDLILRVPDFILRVVDLILRVLECIVTISFGVYLVLWLF
jgi:hypothetical protein